MSPIARGVMIFLRISDWYQRQFYPISQLLQPGGNEIVGAYVNLAIPAQAILVMTAASTLILSVTWSSPAVTKIFNINQMLFIMIRPM